VRCSGCQGIPRLHPAAQPVQAGRAFTLTISERSVRRLSGFQEDVARHEVRSCCMAAGPNVRHAQEGQAVENVQHWQMLSPRAAHIATKTEEVSVCGECRPCVLDRVVPGFPGKADVSENRRCSLRTSDAQMVSAAAHKALVTRRREDQHRFYEQRKVATFYEDHQHDLLPPTNPPPPGHPRRCPAC